VPEITVIWWRDIPAQVVAKHGRASAKVPLSPRFQEAIDAAATRHGLIGTDEYLAQWRRGSRTCGEDLVAEAGSEAARLEQIYDDARLDALVNAGGVDKAADEGVDDGSRPEAGG
jgi:hypothetical protein